MNQRNYAKELERVIASLSEGEVPRLLLHACCAPCSSYCLEYLSNYFSIQVLYYNPNITEREEYEKRLKELERLVAEMEFAHPVTVKAGRYDPEAFFEISRGLEGVPEGGERCFACYRLRLEEAARVAREGGFDYFCTTLTISPLKNAWKLNEIGEELGRLYQVEHLPSDFKKKGGYQRSIALSKEYGLYRQDYCGCVYSRKEAGERKKRQEERSSSQEASPV